MKTALFLSTPPLAFVAAAMLAGLAPPHDPAASPDGPIPFGPRKRAAVMEHSKPTPTDIESAIAEMEHRIGRFPSPEVEIYDAEGMESRLLVGQREATYGRVDLDALNYSRRWVAENPAEMFEWFIREELVPDDLRQSFAEGLFSQWAEQDMASALAALSRMPHSGSRAQALVSTLEVLCQRDPAKARELLLQNIELLEATKKVEFDIFAPGMARTELVSALPPGGLRSRLMAENISSLLGSGIGCGGDNSIYESKAAIGTGLWAQLSIDERRELVDAGLRLSIFDQIQLDGLEDLLRQHAESSGDPRQPSLFIDQYGVRWAERDAEAAVSWAMAHLKGEERTEWSFILIMYAAKKDFDAAMRVWRSLPEGKSREQAAEYLAETAPPDHEAEKATLLNSLPKPGKW